MKTKEKILDAALKLFNTEGISIISSRRISEEIGISYGNLTYHFPKKDDIILQLYLNMQKELDQQLQQLQQQISNLDYMLKSVRILLEIFYKYKFLFLGFSRVNRKFDQIRSHAINNNKERKKILKEIISLMIQQGYVKEEEIPGHYDMIIHGLIIIFNSWISDAEFFYTGSLDKKIDYYLKLLFSFTRPLLTNEGKKTFEQIYQRNKAGKV